MPAVLAGPSVVKWCPNHLNPPILGISARSRLEVTLVAAILGRFLGGVVG